MLDVAQDIIGKDDEILILGDYADFYWFSGFQKDPNINTTVQYEIDSVVKKLRELRKLFPKSKITYLEGNHEYRLFRYIQNCSPHLFNFVDTREILELHDLQIDYIPYGPYQKHNIMKSGLWARHEPYSESKHCCANSLTRSGESLLFGHTHRIQHHESMTMTGKINSAFSCGWLGDKSSKVFTYVKGHPDWALGFGIVTINDGTWFYNQVTIKDYKCLYAGHLYIG